jgi:hypothetical protein
MHNDAQRTLLAANRLNTVAPAEEGARGAASRPSRHRPPRRAPRCDASRDDAPPLAEHRTVSITFDLNAQRLDVDPAGKLKGGEREVVVNREAPRRQGAAERAARRALPQLRQRPPRHRSRHREG